MARAGARTRPPDTAPATPASTGQACDAATGSGQPAAGVRYGLEAIALNGDDRYDFDVDAYFKTGFALMFLGELDQALSVIRVGAEHPADQPVRANLAYLHALAGMSNVAMPEGESATAIAQLKVSSMPGIRAAGFWVQAMLAVNVDVPTAIALYQQAIDTAAESGTRTVGETCRGMQLGLTAQTDDLEAALMGFADAVDAWQDSMGDVYAAAGIGALATWLAGRGYHDGAARLFGVNTRGHPEAWVNPPPEFVALPEVMGDAEFTAAFEAGAALDVRAAAALAHQLLAQVRADHLDA